MNLPEIQCPIPAAIHPDAERADAASVAWIRGFGLCANETERERLARTGCGLLAARIVPYASCETLQIVADFFIWNVSFDDEYCDEGPMSSRPGDLARVLSLILRSIEVPELEGVTSDKYAAALRDIRLRLDRHASPAQMRRWVEAMRGWFMAETWKAGNVAANRTPTLEEYVLLRLYSGGPLTFPILAGIAEGHDLPPDLLANRRVQALTELAASLCTWVSDIISYEKEVQREAGQHNLVMVIQQERHCSKEDAVAAALSLYDNALQLFMRLRKHVEVDYGETASLPNYLRSLAHLIRAPVDWCRLSARYVESMDSEDGTSAASAHTSAATREALGEPLPISSINWWWAYDPARC